MWRSSERHREKQGGWGRRRWWVNDTQITGGRRYNTEAAGEHLGLARSIPRLVAVTNQNVIVPPLVNIQSKWRFRGRIFIKRHILVFSVLPSSSCLSHFLFSKAHHVFLDGSPSLHAIIGFHKFSYEMTMKNKFGSWGNLFLTFCISV